MNHFLRINLNLPSFMLIKVAHSLIHNTDSQLQIFIMTFQYLEKNIRQMIFFGL